MDKQEAKEKIINSSWHWIGRPDKSVSVDLVLDIIDDIDVQEPPAIPPKIAKILESETYDDADYIPALEMFYGWLRQMNSLSEKELNEVFEHKEFDNFRDLKNFLNNLDDKYLDVEFGSEVGGAPLSFYAYCSFDGDVNFHYGH